MKKTKRACAAILPDCTDAPSSILNPDFLSFTIDTSLLLGGHWWGDSKKMIKGVACDKVKKLDLADKKLIAYARALSPAMLRIGGTEADRVSYKPGAKAVLSVTPSLLNRTRPDCVVLPTLPKAPPTRMDPSLNAATAYTSLFGTGGAKVVS